MTKDYKQMRAEFEAWAESAGYNIASEIGAEIANYDYHATKDAWRGWKACWHTFRAIKLGDQR